MDFLTCLFGKLDVLHPRPPATISKSATEYGVVLPCLDSEAAGESDHGEADSLLCLGKSRVGVNAGLDSLQGLLGRWIA
jgi:hypothetical protein